MEGDSNNLQFAFRTRVKLMYRPSNLPGNAQEAPAQLQWSAGVDANNQPVLKARNPSSFVVNVAGVEVQLNGKSFEAGVGPVLPGQVADRKSTRLNSSHLVISYAVFCLKKK